MFLSEICWSRGDPSRVSRKGKACPSEAGRGKCSPPANPDGVTAEAMKRRNEGFHFENNIFGEYPVDPQGINFIRHIGKGEYG